MADKFTLPSGAAKKRAAPEASAAKKQEHAPTEYTPEQQEAMLSNYVLLDRSQWDHIQKGESVRYFGVDGKFRVGGTVVIPSFANAKAAAGQKERRLMRLSSGAGGRGFSWVVPWDQIRDLYVGTSSSVSMLQEAAESNIKILDDNMRRIAAALQKLSARVAALEATLERR